MELTKPLNERTQQLRALAPVLFLSIIFSLIMLGIFWDRVSSLDLWDDDDYMRLVQISGWVTSGNWYLQPLERLNPQDGQIIHWSRVPDILPYVLIKILSAVTDSETATLVSISITPLIYLCVTVVCISAVTNKLFGAQYAFVSAAYALSSYLLVKFLPGSIDHHNVQLFITALFILLIPNTEQGFKDEKKAWTQGMLAALSLWVGVANILFFITALTVLVLYGIFKREVSLKYASTISLSAFILSLLFILLNRPYSEFFDIHIDAISIPFSFCFLSGFIFCRTYIKLSNKLHLKPLLILVCSIISLSPTLIIFPQLLTDFAYSGYPEVLRFYWLDLVSETFSTLHYINKEGFFSSSNIILMFAPAILAILAIDKKKPIFNFYAIFLFSLAIPFFWQARASMVPVLLAIPLQAFVAVTLSKKVKSNLYKALIILALSPIFIGSILDTVKATGNKEVSRATEISLTQETEKHKNLNTYEGGRLR